MLYLNKDLVKKRLDEKNWNQTSLAIELEVTRQAVSFWLCHPKNVSLMDVSRIAKALDLSAMGLILEREDY